MCSMYPKPWSSCRLQFDLVTWQGCVSRQPHDSVLSLLDVASCSRMPVLLLQQAHALGGRAVLPLNVTAGDLQVGRKLAAGAEAIVYQVRHACSADQGSCSRS